MLMMILKLLSHKISSSSTHFAHTCNALQIINDATFARMVEKNLFYFYFSPLPRLSHPKFIFHFFLLAREKAAKDF
jgi:hypothetical protein